MACRCARVSQGSAGGALADLLNLLFAACGAGSNVLGAADDVDGLDEEGWEAVMERAREVLEGDAR